MKKGMNISLKSGERIFVNGAVLRVDRKVSLEFLNDVSFLLENHVLQAADATTPLRQLYFITQTLLIDPANAGEIRRVFDESHELLLATFDCEETRAELKAVQSQVAEGRVFDALKTIRGLYQREAEIMAVQTRIAKVNTIQELDVASWKHL